MFVVKLHYKQPIEVVDAYLVAHRDHLSRGYENNYLVASGPCNPRTGGIIISHLTSREKLLAFMNDDPFIVNHIAGMEIIEFTPVKYHEKFSDFVQ